MADVLGAVLDGACHRLNGGSELLHAVLLDQLQRRSSMMPTMLWLMLLVILSLFRLVLASIVARSSRVVEQRGSTLKSIVASVLRSELMLMLPARVGESANTLLFGGAMGGGAGGCCEGSGRVYSRARRGPAGCRDVPRESTSGPPLVEDWRVGNADTVCRDWRRRVGVVVTAVSNIGNVSSVVFGFFKKRTSI